MRCKFWNECPNYDEESKPCKNKGLYHEDDGIFKMKTANCYNEMEERKGGKDGRIQ